MGNVVLQCDYGDKCEHQLLAGKGEDPRYVCGAPYIGCRFQKETKKQ